MLLCLLNLQSSVVFSSLSLAAPLDSDALFKHYIQNDMNYYLLCGSLTIYIKLKKGSIQIKHLSLLKATCPIIHVFLNPI